MAQDVTRQTEIKNCVEFFPPLLSLVILKQEATLRLRSRFFCMAYFPILFFFPRCAEGSMTVLIFLITAQICLLHRVNTNVSLQRHTELSEHSGRCLTRSSSLAPGLHVLKAASELRHLFKPSLSSTLTVTFLHSSMSYGFSSRWSPFHSKVSQSQAPSGWSRCEHPHPSPAPLWHPPCIIGLSALTSPLQIA